ncbi:MAG TPA: trypsin-like peptidase domain-containing protein [Acidimicrobiales bacterium]|nr:trypsin-like peptidase domain-containing protein [Acidimicrobiales bacterium]
MDTPQYRSPGTDGPAEPTAEVTATPGGAVPGGTDEPTAAIPLGPAPLGWPPPAPGSPPPGSPPPPSAGPGGGAWGPIATPYGLAWGPPPVPPAGGPARGGRGLLFAVTALAVALSTLVGLAVGYAVWRPTAAPSGTSNGGGSSFRPFGTSGGTPPSPGSGSTGTNGSSGSSSTGGSTAVASRVDPGLVDIDVVLKYADESAAGTGQVLTSSGEVLTNNHVIDGATSISATDVGNGRTYSAKVVGYDRTADLAVLQLQGASGLATVSVGDSAKVTVGQSVVAIGNAGGTGGTPRAAAGSITNLDQAITASDDNGANPEQLTGLIEVDADVQPGDSGGPLVNGAGQVLGVDTAASANYSFSSAGGDGYAIPINQATNIAREIEAGKGSSTIHVGPTALLGVVVQPTNSASSPFGGGGFNGGGSTSDSGAEVIQVNAGSPAQAAGIVAGDVITSLGGRSVSTPSDLSAAISGHSPGDSVQVQWEDAQGNSHSATVKLAAGAPPD